MVALVVVFCLAISGLVGALIGHSVWGTPAKASTEQTGQTTAPSNNSNNSNSNGNNSSSGTSAAAIEARIAPALVDVNTTLTYEGVEGAGTGMVLTSNGLVLTNNHVVEGATSISVTDIGNGKTYNAKVVGYDRTKDVAVLQLINASNLATVSLSTSGVTVGEEVVAVGNAGGSGGQPSYAQGTISATGQSITASDEATGGTEQLTGLIETNADIVAGDSGGPLVNSDGQVIAMDTAAAQGFQFQSSGNQGYSIPINEADGIAKLIKAGTASATVHVGSTAFLGVTVQEATSQDGSSAASGAQIYQVIKGGPAAAAGLESGDTITELGGKSVTSPEDLTNVILSEKAGNSVQVVYTDANGATQTTTVQLGSGPPQ